MLPEWPVLAKKCIIMRSKGLGALSIKFGGHLSKFEEWPNSSNFDKLRVDSLAHLKARFAGKAR